MTELGIATVDGVVPMDEFEDDSCTLPMAVPPDLTPDMLRLLSQIQHATVERIASDLESIGRGRSVLIGSHEAAARARSMQALRRVA